MRQPVASIIEEKPQTQQQPVRPILHFDDTSSEEEEQEEGSDESGTEEDPTIEGSSPSATDTGEMPSDFEDVSFLRP